MIAVLEDGVPRLKADAVVLESHGTATTAVKELPGGAAGVAAARAGHDVPELDAAGLAVPEADADEEEDDDAADDGQGDDEISVVGAVGELRVRGAVLVHDDVERGRLVLSGGPLDVGHEGDADVVRAVALEVLALDLEGEHAPVGGDALRLVELDVLALL